VTEGNHEKPVRVDDEPSETRSPHRPTAILDVITTPLFSVDL